MIITDPAKVGPPEYMSDESKELTLRVHDECMFSSLDLHYVDTVFRLSGR